VIDIHSLAAKQRARRQQLKEKKMNADLTTGPDKASTARLKVKVYPYLKGAGMGNIMWTPSHPMRYGKFPASHPVGGGMDSPAGNMQCGHNDGMTKFRERGYWASCFPEGDGITWEPKRGQSDEQCMTDIRECFGWDAVWGRKP
jgi:hypothetical protein